MLPADLNERAYQALQGVIFDICQDPTTLGGDSAYSA